MNLLKMLKRSLDRVLLVTALTLLAVMVLIIVVQVFSRQIFSYTPSWSEELSRVLFVWVSFLGIAYGFKEKLHIGVGLVVNMLPEQVQKGFDYLAKVIVIGLGIFMIYFGWQFTMLMGSSTLPGLGLPSSVLYASIPATGIFVTLYGIELLFRKGMHRNFDGVTEG
ncbi:TRAP transporter small permease [Halobacillus sp. Marseille-P3879]|uniref:TRAP transporter small permease n=1 Tax=Halobacillus sp. Marseille-P3879 TaxID=2045014 RepID=UPI000C7DC618|nr:TRAP transporter small permease [Halobacillus sp. Marseille-P3879]